MGGLKHITPQIETFIEEIELFSEAFTYFRVIPSPLIPSMIEGSATKTARGWAQMLQLNPRELSVDPDSPEDKVNYCNIKLTNEPPTRFSDFRLSLVLPPGASQP